MKVSLRQYWTLLSQYLRRQRGRFTMLAVLLFLSIGLQLGIPQITRHFIDSARSGATGRVLLFAAIAFLVCSVIQQLVTVAAHYVGEVVAWTSTNELRADLAEHCLRLDMRFHNERTPGELIERIDGDVLAVSQFFSQLVIMVIGSVFLLGGILVVLFLEDPRVGGLFTGFSLGALFMFVKLRNIAVPHDKARRDALTEVFGFLEERLAGTEDIRSSGAVAFVLQGLHRLHYILFGKWRKAELMYVGIRLLAGITMTAGFAIAFVSGYYLYRAGSMTIGAVYLVVHYTQLISRPIRILTQQVQNLQNIGANIERMRELLSITTNIAAEPEHLESPAAPPYGLEFDGVDFAYVEGEPVLREFTFDLAPGRVLGVVGRTGSGKTTIARLALRLYEPQQGRVLLGGVDVRRQRLSDLRNRVGMITQDVQLFQASVRDNLTFFDDTVADERLEEVIEELGLSGWYASLPEGLDSKLETGGRGLSAGEGQLLALTRIFLRDPGLVILDEASSRLDPATEKLLDRVLDRLLEGRTAAIIAHRLATVRRADEVMVVDQGRVLEKGVREALSRDPNSHFHRLLQTGLEEAPA